MKMPIFILFIFLELIVSSCKNKKEIKENNPIYSEIDFNFLLPLSKTGQIIHHKYYTLSYSEKDEQAEWVAYWLNRKDIVYIKYKRPHFVNDPMVEEESANWKIILVQDMKGDIYALREIENFQRKLLRKRFILLI